MKLCVFADIHGNGPAWEAAVPMLRAERADAYVFLGDCCGYYFDQLQILPSLRALPNLIALVGNHDRMFLDIRAGNQDLRNTYLRKYGRSMEHLLSAECADLAAWLDGLGSSFDDPQGDFCCFHGSPVDALEGYVYPDSPLDGWPPTGPCCLLGHTHHKMQRSLGQRGLIVNPGSLGQPRDGGWPTYAVVDLPDGQVQFRPVSYDKARVIRSIDEAKDENRYLRDVLDRQP